MKILFLNDKGHDDVNNWSGTTAHMARMLEDRGHQLYYIDYLTGNFFLRCFYRGLGILTGKQIKANREPNVLKSMARRRDREKKKFEYDLIFTPNSMCLCYLKDEKPSVFYADATYGGMEGFYPNFTNVSVRTSKNGNFHEKMALDTCTRAIYASQWARQTAIDCYGIDGAKLDVVNFGANVDSSYDEAQIMRLAEKRWEKEEKCLLFVGVEWERKGGPKVLEAVRILTGRGYPVKLAIVGCQPKLSEEEQRAVRRYGYLSKKDAGQAEQLHRLYEESFLFFMPSLYECAGIVYAEAAAFGLPSVASAAGGVPDMVIEGESGYLLSADASPEAYADFIERIFQDREAYLSLCKRTFTCSKRLFTWESVGERVDRVLEAAAKEKSETLKQRRK